MRLGCCTEVLNYKTAENLGYDFIEFSASEINSMTSESFNGLVHTIRRGKLPCLRFNDYCKGDTPLVGPQVDFHVLEEYADKICGRGGEIGVKSLGIGAPKARILPKEFSINDADEQMMRFLTMICEKAKKYDIKVLMEAVHSGVCNYINRTQEAVDMVSRLNIPNLKIVLDFYHMQVMGESIESFCSVSDWVEHVHVSNRDANNKRAYLLDTDEDECRKIAKTLIRCGYDGTVSVEAPTVDFNREAAVCLNVMKRSFE